jgi:hypothetical protein
MARLTSTAQYMAFLKAHLTDSDGSAEGHLTNSDSSAEGSLGCLSDGGAEGSPEPDGTEDDIDHGSLDWDGIREGSLDSDGID